MHIYGVHDSKDSPSRRALEDFSVGGGWGVFGCLVCVVGERGNLATFWRLPDIVAFSVIRLSPQPSRSRKKWKSIVFSIVLGKAYSILYKSDSGHHSKVHELSDIVSARSLLLFQTFNILYCGIWTQHSDQHSHCRH